MRWLVVMPALLLAGCEMVERTETIGHKGRARLNPYLAAERMLGEFGYEIRSEFGWPNFEDEELAMVAVPASTLSTEVYVGDLETWVAGGGHAVILLEYGEVYRNDWRDTAPAPDFEISEALGAWMAREGVEIAGGNERTEAQSVEVAGGVFEVWMKSGRVLSRAGRSRDGLLVSAPSGDGRLTLVADARPFRNRYIGDHDHAALLLELAERSPAGGAVAFIRNSSLSFWGLLWSHAWPALVALILLIVFWLWKNMPRFGPLDCAEAGSPMRSQAHHLEALGGFHWRLDRGQGLLQPLRESIRERTHTLMVATGRRDADIFEVMAERAGLTRERAERALTFARARDAGSFTRIVSDLQRIHQSIP